MTNHIRTVGILWIVWGALGMIVGLLIAAVLIGAGFIADVAGGEAEALSILTIIAACICVLTLVLSLPDIIVGIGLVKHKEWARILGFILAALNLLSIPVGTALAVYTFIVLLSPDNQGLFSPTQSATNAPASEQTT